MRRTSLTRRATHGVAVAALLGSAVLLAPAASATTAGDGLWYFTDTGIAEAQQVADGTGVKIALLDNQINPSAPDLVGANLTVREPSYCAESEGSTPVPATATTEEAQHATSMASLLVGTATGFPGDQGVNGVAPGAHVTLYVQGYEGGCFRPAPESGGPNQAFKDAIADGTDIIVVPGTMASVPDVAEAIRNGVVVIGAGGNDSAEVWGRPAVLNGVVATGQMTSDGSIAPASAWGPQLGLLAPASAIRVLDPTMSYYGTAGGSSNSSVITAGVIALAMSAHPGATSNQILQAVVRTTDGSVHEPARDERRGFGALDVRQLMALDPTTLPDVNPFIRTDADASPSAEVLGLTTETTPEPTADTTEPATDALDQNTRDEPADGPNVLVTGFATLAVIVLVAVVVILRRRRGTGDGPDQDEHPAA